MTNSRDCVKIGDNEGWEMSKYYIEFNIAKDKKSIQTVTCNLDSEVVIDMEKQMDVSLCQHPLYPALERYVLANPSPKILDESTGKH